MYSCSVESIDSSLPNALHLAGRVPLFLSWMNHLHCRHDNDPYLNLDFKAFLLQGLELRLRWDLGNAGLRVATGKSDLACGTVTSTKARQKKTKAI